MLHTKSGVQFSPIQPGGFRILWALEQASFDLGCPLIITCGSEGHPLSDPHTRGEAYDVRVADLSAAQLSLVKNHLRSYLGSGFTVLYEVPFTPVDSALDALVDLVNVGASAPHLHIQVKKGMTYPLQQEAQ